MMSAPPSNLAWKRPNPSPRMSQGRRLMKPSPWCSADDENDEQMKPVVPVLPVVQIRPPRGRIPIIRAVPNHLMMGQERIGGLVSSFHELYPRIGSMSEQEEGKWLSTNEGIPARDLEDLVRSTVLPSTAIGQMQEIVRIFQLVQKTGLRDGACLSRAAHQRMRKLEDASGWRLHASLGAIMHAQKETVPAQQSCLDARYKLEIAQIQGASWEELHVIGEGAIAQESGLAELENSQNKCLVDFELEFVGRWAAECIAFLERKTPPLGLAKDAVALALRAFAQFPNAMVHFNMAKVTLTSGSPFTNEETWPTTDGVGDRQLEVWSASIARRLQMSRDKYPKDFARCFLTTSFARRKICTALRDALQSKRSYVIPETNEEWGPSILQGIYDKLHLIEEREAGFMVGFTIKITFAPGLASRIKRLQDKRMICRCESFRILQDIILSSGASAKEGASSVIEPIQMALRHALTAWVTNGKARPLAKDVKDVMQQDIEILPSRKAVILDQGQANLTSLHAAESFAKSRKAMPILIQDLPIPKRHLDVLLEEQNIRTVSESLSESHPEAFGTHGFIARNCLLLGSTDEDILPDVELSFQTEQETPQDEVLDLENVVLQEEKTMSPLEVAEQETVSVNLCGWNTGQLRFFFRTLGYHAQMQDALVSFTNIRLMPRLLYVQRLSLAGLGNLQAVKEDLFLSCPQLQDLNLRGCEQLFSLAGLEHAVNLESLYLANCGTLQHLKEFSSGDVFKTKSSAVRAPSLKFIDLHDCRSLSVDTILELVDRIGCVSTKQQEPVVQLMTNIGKLRKGDHALIKSFFVDDTGDAVYELVGPLVDGSKDEVSPNTTSEIVPIKQEDVSFVRELIQASARYLRAGSVVACVWPTSEMGELSSSLSEEMRFAACQGVRAMVVRAIKAAKAASQNLANQPTDALAQARQAACGQDLLTALHRFGVVPGVKAAPGDKGATKLKFPHDPYIDYPTVRSVASQGCAPTCKAVQLKHLTCLLCKKAVPITGWEFHETQQCSARICRCNCLGAEGLRVPRIGASDEWVPCGMPVRVTDMQHHQQVERALQKAVVTWSIDHMTLAIRDAKKKLGDSPTTLCNPQILAAQARLKRITEKVKLVTPVLKKGNIKIDYMQCSVILEKPIQFAPRKAPDTSAEFDPKFADESHEIIGDLAQVLAAFQRKMIVEGCTGSAVPPDYWQELADNRAKLLVSALIKSGVPKGLCIPLGVPGGGAKVLIYPAPAQDYDSNDPSED